MPANLRIRIPDTDVDGKQFEAKGADLTELYRFRDATTFLLYLARYSFLREPLRDAYYKITEFFPGSDIFLELAQDPESEEDPSVIAWISTSLDADEAFEQLRKFDQDWFLSALSQFRGKFSINVDFR